MAASTSWYSFRRSLLRGAIAIGVFLLVGIAELAMSPHIPADSPLPWTLVALAIVSTFAAWKVALRWSFYPEDEPWVITDLASAGSLEVFSTTADLAAVQVPALAFVAVVICCAAPTPKLRVEDRGIIHTESFTATCRINL